MYLVLKGLLHRLKACLSADARRVTDQDGRCSTLLDPSTKLAAGVYKMKFGTGNYFDKVSKPCFYPFVEVRKRLPKGKIAS
jgi:5-hydroxyisourate hydrolase-like protein (transthyretin family)